MVSHLFTKRPPPKLSFQRVSDPREALTGLFRDRPARKNRRVFAPLCPREGLTAFPERRFQRVFACGFCPEKLPLSCNKALPRLRRQPCRIATAAPLHRRKGLTAEQGGPYGAPTLPKGRENEYRLYVLMYEQVMKYTNKASRRPLIFDTRMLAIFGSEAEEK